MATLEFITKEDLLQFKHELLNELRNTLSKPKTLETNREWLKSNEVQKLLKISANTLQTLRLNGNIPFTKIGGRIYYQRGSIASLLIPQK